MKTLKLLIFKLLILHFAFCIEVLGEPLNLEKCIDIAISQNPSTVRARLNLSAAGVDVRTSQSDLIPQISASTGYGRSGPGVQTWISSTGDLITSQETYSTNFRAFQTIFDPDVYAQIKKSYSNEDFMEKSLEEKEAEIILKTTEDYYNLLRSKRLVEVRATALKEREGNLNKAERLLQLGSASKADLLKAKVGVSQARVELVQAERGLEMEKANLSATLGYSPKKHSEELVSLDIVDDLGEVDRELPDLDLLLKEAESQRPEIFQAKSRISIARSDLFASRGRFLPRITLSGSYSYFGPQFPKNFEIWDERDTWRINLDASWNILTGYSRFTSVKRASRDVAMAQEDLRLQELDISLEVQSAFLALKEALALLDLTKETEAEAEESYKASKGRYELGAASILELTDAEVSLTEARTMNIQSLYDYKIAKARLDKSVGNTPIINQ
jgi:outer membrane protein TolC